MLVLPLALIVFVSAGVSAASQESEGELFDGEWTLTFDVATPPGGVTLTNEYGSISPYHVVFRATKRSFQVQTDGTFAWREEEDGALKINGTGNYFGTRNTYWESHQPLLKAVGKATATRNVPGSPQPYERSLEVTLDWTGGNGAYADNYGGAGSYVVDAVGEQMTVTGVGGPPTQTPMVYWQAKWSLKAARIVREEIGPDQIRETTTYEGTRQAEIATQTSGSHKVTERIEVKQVRNLNLVPRG